MGESHPFLSNFAPSVSLGCRLFFSCLVVIVEFVHKHDRHRHESNRRKARLSLLCPYLQSCVPPALHGGGRRVFGQEVE